MAVQARDGGLSRRLDHREIPPEVCDVSEPGSPLRILAERLDATMLPALLAAASVSTVGTRDWLRARSMPFFDPDGPPVRLADADRTADHVIAQTQGHTAALGAVAGIAGLLSVGPEVAGWLAACLRLAQRLAIVYGLDPSTDRGQVAVTRALAAAFEVDLPTRGLVDLRLSEVVGAVPAPASPDASSVGAQVARSLIWQAARRMTGRVGRLLPLVASGIGAVDNHSQAAELGDRMKDVLRRLATPHHTSDRRIVEAEVVEGG